LNYAKYKNARNASWQCLIDYNISSLPVIVTEIAKKSNITVIDNSTVDFLSKGQSGATIYQDNHFYIVYKDSESSHRCRFTIAHELGHIFLGHLLVGVPKYRTFDINDDAESSANVFARDLLAPACVLHELGITAAKDIAKICNISIESATYREQRMKELEKRKAWYLNPLEIKVKEQFEDFIKKKKAE
jgi:Zn-dependent peptidase ImmA (M78 family)